LRRSYHKIRKKKGRRMMMKMIKKALTVKSKMNSNLMVVRDYNNISNWEVKE